MENLLENLKNWNFDNGNFIVEEMMEVSFDGDNFKLELPTESITCETLEEIVSLV